MNRAGWIFLGGIVAMGWVFGSNLHFESSPPPAAAPAPAAAPTPLVAAMTPASDPPHLQIPVQGIAPAAIHDTWGQSRANGQRAHQGTDIMAASGTAVLAAAPGTVEKLFFSHGGGGITLYVRSPDRLWSYYYAHLSGYAPGMAEGLAVKTGDPLGYVGDTGNAGTGNFHLHFGVSRMRPEERWYQGEPVNPYPLLRPGA